MPLYLVERTFPIEADPGLPNPADPFEVHLDFHDKNAQASVAWIQSFVTPDARRSFCLYQGPSPEAVRLAAGLNGLPVDRINEVRLWSADPVLKLLPQPQDGMTNTGFQPKIEP